MSERDIFGNLLVGFMLNTGKKEYLLDVKLQHDFNVPFCRCLYSCRNCTVGQWSALHISKWNGYIPRPWGRLSNRPATDKFSKWITQMMHWIQVLHLSTGLRRKKTMLISDQSFQASLSAMMVPQTPTMYLAPQYSYPPVSVKLLINILPVKKSSIFSC